MTALNQRNRVVYTGTMGLLGVLVIAEADDLSLRKMQDACDSTLMSFTPPWPATGGNHSVGDEKRMAASLLIRDSACETHCDFCSPHPDTDISEPMCSFVESCTLFALRDQKSHIRSELSLQIVEEWVDHEWLASPSGAA